VNACRRLCSVYLPPLCALAAWTLLPGVARAEDPEPLSVSSKLGFHVQNAYGPLQLVATGAYAGILQDIDAPREWGQGAGAYGKRFLSTLGGSGIHGALAFGLDSVLHEDPRYFRSANRGFWRRSAHAVRGTMMTRTDSGGETISAWRLGSDYGAAFLSNQWYPRRLNTARLGMIQGSLSLGFDTVTNLGAEFWPDIKKIVRRKK